MIRMRAAIITTSITVKVMPADIIMRAVISTVTKSATAAALKENVPVTTVNVSIITREIADTVTAIRNNRTGRKRNSSASGDRCAFFE